MASTTQADLAVEDNTTRDNSAAAFHALEINLLHIGNDSNESPRTCKKVNKRRRASSGGVQGNLSNARGPKAARAICKAKGKQKADLRDADPSPPEEKSDKGGAWEADPCMFAGIPFLHFIDDTCCSPKARVMI
jgi:hypothetical protein